LASPIPWTPAKERNAFNFTQVVNRIRTRIPVAKIKKDMAAFTDEEGGQIKAFRETEKGF
jgi:hypothetical protein